MLACSSSILTDLLIIDKSTFKISLHRGSYVRKPTNTLSEDLEASKKGRRDWMRLKVKVKGGYLVKNGPKNDLVN